MASGAGMLPESLGRVAVTWHQAEELRPMVGDTACGGQSKR